jgi:hypothetical protein
MKIIKYQIENYNINEAQTLCEQIETQTGLKLHAAFEGDTVEGFLNTDSNGNIEICLYEAEDLT